MKKDKKNLFDTDIEMIDLDSIGNLEFRYEELGAPNPELGDDLKMVMKETQVFSSDDIEKALEKNAVEEMGLDLGQTRVIDSVEQVEGFLSDEEVAETVNEEVYETPEDTSYIETANEEAEYESSEEYAEEPVDEDAEYADDAEDNSDGAVYEESEEYSDEDTYEESVEEPEYAEDSEEPEYEESSEEYEDEASAEEDEEVLEDEEDVEVPVAAAEINKVSKSEKLEEDESYDFEEDNPKEKKAKEKKEKAVKEKSEKNPAKSAKNAHAAHSAKNAKNDKNNKKVKNKKKNKRAKYDEDDEYESKFGIIEIAGVFVAVVLIVLLAILGIKLYNNKAHSNDVEQFASIGALYSDIDSIGYEGIDAIGQKASIDSIVTPVEEIPKEVTEPEEEEEKKEAAPISVNFSSIEKDLKIKFINKTSGKLVTGVRFEVSAKGPDGKTYSWVDTDLDGVIYVDKLAPGNYEVKVVSIDPYEFPDKATTVKVQDTVVYQVINVMDEAMDMSQVNLAQEENQGKDVDQGVALQDTVKLLDSTATPMNGVDGFVKINKSDIKDPKTLVNAFEWGGFRRVDNVNVTDIVLSGATEINVGGSTTISAAVVPEEATNKTLNWSSSNESVATVDSSGNVTGLSAGDVTITVSATDESGVSKTIGIKVNDIPPADKKVESVTISGQRNIKKGETLNLQVNVAPDDATNKSVTWSSNNESVATVNANGVVTGVNAGSAVITAKANDGSEKLGSVTIGVEDTKVMVSQIILSGNTGIAAKTSTKITAQITPDNATDKRVGWSSSNPDVASVDANGTVTGNKSGEAEIFAEALDGSGIKTSIKISVTKADTLRLTLSDVSGKEITEKQTLFVGEIYQILPRVEGFETAGNVGFAASNNCISVSAEGIVTAVTAGSADVNVTTVEKGADGNPVTKTVSFIIKDDPSKNSTNALQYNKEGTDYQVYYKTSDGKYIEAKWADYYKYDEFYIKGNVEYKYTGWQTLNGNVYYFDENGNKITGEQVIGGMKYSFASDGSLIKGNGSRGIDVSTYNGTIDWTAVKNSGISFVIIRCGFRGYTKGGLIYDSKYKSYIQGASAAGLKVGLYFFSQAKNEAEAVEEASLCVNLAQGNTISYPIFIDSEYANGARSGRADGLDKATRTAVCKAFCETIKSAGYTPGVYASKSWLNDKLDANQLSSYKIWLAHYTGQTDYTGKYDLWQHTAKGSVNGIKGNVDLDISYLGY
ncbi:MAG: Ig-like domain-containing protein [Lachnospiraceae bacterium]|nr:Ig-like domain-containing protein [Lachnospiraceae bacterium]